jgi:pantoate--beta-alanine ligase
MIQFKDVSETSAYLAIARREGKTVGFVPTMGALHQGHLNLVRRSKRENDLTVCSIFVNPIQFNNAEDLAKYPRTPERDANLLQDAGCDLIFAPEAEGIYPDGKPAAPDLEFGMLDKVMEGKFRPGHFDGVAIVVKRLFDIVQPTHAYFGKKDYQQLAVIRHMVVKLKIPVNIIPFETVREPDGLAMSSRNIRLTEAERKLAPKIFETLLQVREQAGKTDVAVLKEWAISRLREHREFNVEYFEIADHESLLPVDRWDSTDHAVAFIAVFLGAVRLIDNIELFS